MSLANPFLYPRFDSEARDAGSRIVSSRRPVDAIRSRGFFGPRYSRANERAGRFSVDPRRGSIRSIDLYHRASFRLAEGRKGDRMKNLANENRQTVKCRNVCGSGALTQTGILNPMIRVWVWPALATPSGFCKPLSSSLWPRYRQSLPPVLLSPARREKKKPPDIFALQKLLIDSFQPVEKSRKPPRRRFVPSIRPYRREVILKTTLTLAAALAFRRSPNRPHRGW